MIYRMRNVSFEDFMFDSDHSYWKKIVVNFLLASTLTLKITGLVTTLTFLNYFAGVGLFAIFTATLNLEE